MGSLRCATDGRRHRLRAVTVVGRSARCDLQLGQGEVSGQHARIRWDGGAWVLQDLDSRNGTYVDDARLEVPEIAQLQVGMRVAFGHVSNVWRVEDLDSPPCEAVPSDGGRAVPSVNDVLLLALDDARATVFVRGGAWVVEDQDGHIHAVHDQEEVEVGGRRFRLHLPRCPDRGAVRTMGTVSFRVGERLSVGIDGVWTALPAGPRLLELARSRADHPDGGWDRWTDESTEATQDALASLHILGASHVLQVGADGAVRFGGRQVRRAAHRKE